MRVSGIKLNNTLKAQLIKTLAQVISDLKTPEEALLFIKDFYTESELEGFAKRLAIAYWLKKGRNYDNIQNNLKISSATVSAMTKTMKKEGFEKALKLIEAEEWANKWLEKIKKLKILTRAD